MPVIAGERWRGLHVCACVFPRRLVFAVRAPGTRARRKPAQPKGLWLPFVLYRFVADWCRASPLLEIDLSPPVDFCWHPSSECFVCALASARLLWQTCSFVSGVPWLVRPGETPDGAAYSRKKENTIRLKEERSFVSRIG